MAKFLIQPRVHLIDPAHSDSFPLTSLVPDPTTLQDEDGLLYGRRLP